MAPPYVLPRCDDGLGPNDAHDGEWNSRDPAETGHGWREKTLESDERDAHERRTQGGAAGHSYEVDHVRPVSSHDHPTVTPDRGRLRCGRHLREEPLERAKQPAVPGGHRGICMNRAVERTTLGPTVESSSLRHVSGFVAATD